jgi:tetratricopeptide (TPR) repeat protein
VVSAGQSIMPYRDDQAYDIAFRPAEPARFPDADSALEWLDRAVPEVLAAIRFAASHGMPAPAWQLSDVMWPLFLYRGRYTERLEFDREGLAAADDSGDLTGRAKMLGRIGLAVLDLGHHDEADAYFRQALALWTQLGNSRRVGGSLRRLGLLAAARQRPAEAAGWFTQALDLYRELGATRQIALTLSDLGDMLTSMGRAADAIGLLEEAAPLLEDADDSYNQARLFIRLGQAHQRAGDFTLAAGQLRLALSSMREIGSSRGEAEVLVSLGELAEGTGQHADARRWYGEARTILVRLDSPRAADVSGRLARLDDGGAGLRPPADCHRHLVQILQSTELRFAQRRSARKRVADLPPGVQRGRLERFHRVPGREPAVQE